MPQGLRRPSRAHSIKWAARRSRSCAPPSRQAGSCGRDRKSTRLNSSHRQISYAVFCLKTKEHTSELQSQSNLVCRLLLEKKKSSAPPNRPPHTYTARRVALQPPLTPISGTLNVVPSPHGS